MLETGRHLDRTIEGAVNFRDLGGLRAEQALVRHGLIFRSGMTRHITERGLEALAKDFGLTTIIDLRSQQEFDNDGSAAFHSAGIRHLHTPVYAVLNLSPEAQAQRSQEMREGRYDWAASYQRMVSQNPESFRRIFALFADEAIYPAVFHCTAGRDRTGVTAALLLSVLGISREEIVKDYHRTGPILQEYVPHFINPKARNPMNPEQMARLLMTTTDAMSDFLEWLDVEYGGPVAYLRSTGFTDEQLARMRELLLITGA